MHKWFKVDSTGIEDIGLDMDQIMRCAQISRLDMLIFDRSSTSPCTILGREGIILLDLKIIKMIIKPEEVLVMEIREPEINCVYNELVRIFDENAVPKEGSWEDIWDADHDYGTLLEFRALEVALKAVYSYFIRKARQLENDFHLASREIASKITSGKWERVWKLNRDISKFKTFVEKVRDELARLMENDNDIAALYLSRKFDASSSDVDYILMMLQPYFLQMNMIEERLSKLQEDVSDKLEFIKYQLENDENKLIKFTIILNMASIGVSVGTIMFWLWLWYMSE